jgi:hypothetical protein
MATTQDKNLTANKTKLLGNKVKATSKPENPHLQELCAASSMKCALTEAAKPEGLCQVTQHSEV